MPLPALCRAAVYAFVAAAVLTQPSPSFADHDDDKVTVCHVPRGNPSARHTITVGEKAVDKHLDHGDYLGRCRDDRRRGDSEAEEKLSRAEDKLERRVETRENRREAAEELERARRRHERGDDNLDRARDQLEREKRLAHARAERDRDLERARREADRERNRRHADAKYREQRREILNRYYDQVREIDEWWDDHR